MAQFDPAWATTTIGGVPCAESVRGIEEGIGRGQGPQLTRIYQCAWADRYKVANALLGVTTIFTSGGPVSFDLPLSHPESPNAYANDVRIAGKGRCTQGPNGPAYALAEITVRYGASNYGFTASPTETMQNIDQGAEGDPINFIYCTQSIQTGEEPVEIPGNMLVYNKSGAVKSFTKPLVKPYAHAILTLVFHEMPFLPVSTLQYYNFVNDRPFLGTKAGHTRFKGSFTTRQFGTTEVKQEVTNTYEFRPSYPWNFFPDATDPSNLDWVEVKYRNGKPLHNSVDLRATLPNGYWF